MHIAHTKHDKTPATCKKTHILTGGSLYTGFYKHVNKKQVLLPQRPEASLTRQLPPHPPHINHKPLSVHNPKPYVPRTMPYTRGAPKPTANITAKASTGPATPANIHTVKPHLKQRSTQARISPLNALIHSVTPITQQPHRPKDAHKHTPATAVAPEELTIESDEDDAYMAQYLTEEPSNVSIKLKY